MMPLDSLITLLGLCFWNELIVSQHPPTCRLPLSAQTEQPSCWMQGTLSLLQPWSLLHSRPLTLHFPRSDHTSRPWPVPTELLALPWCCVLCLSVSIAVVKLEKAHLFFLGTHQHLYWHSGQAEGCGFPRSFRVELLQSACLLVMQHNCLQMQLVCLPLPGPGSPAHICMSLLCYWACRNVVFIGTDLLGRPKLT